MPTLVDRTHKFVALSAGRWYICALDASNDVLCFGEAIQPSLHACLLFMDS